MQKPLNAAESRNSKKWFVIDQVGDNQFIVTFTRKGMTLLAQTQPKSSREALADEADMAALLNILYDKISYIVWENETFPGL